MKNQMVRLLKSAACPLVGHSPTVKKLGGFYCRGCGATMQPTQDENGENCFIIRNPRTSALREALELLFCAGLYVWIAFWLWALAATFGI